MSTRKDYLNGKADTINKALDIQLKLDKNTADKEIIELEEIVQIAESHLLTVESNPEGFNLTDIINAEIALEVAKDDLQRAKIARARLFPACDANEQSIGDIHNTED